MNNPYSTPGADVETSQESGQHQFIGFWARAGASFIDSILLLGITYPILYAIYGQAYFTSTELRFVEGPADFFLSYIFPLIAIITFWIYKSATPGKMVVKAKIVDAKTGGKPSTGKLIGRYFGYYLSTIPLGLGFLWVAWDKNKQGWHDKLAGTVVVRSK